MFKVKRIFISIETNDKYSARNNCTSDQQMLQKNTGKIGHNQFF